QPRVGPRPEIDERCNGLAIRKQSLPVQVRKHFIIDAEAVRPDQPTVLPDAPAIADVPAGHFLAAGCTAEHKPLEDERVSAGRKLELRVPAEPCPIEDDRLLR